MGWWGFAKREQLHGLGFGFDLGSVPLCTIIGSAHSAMVAIQRSLTRARNSSVDAPVAAVIPCGLGKGAGRRQQAGAHPRCQMLTRARLACLRPLPLPHLVHPPLPLRQVAPGEQGMGDGGGGAGEGGGGRGAEVPGGPKKPKSQEAPAGGGAGLFQDYFRTRTTSVLTTHLTKTEV